ncbi:Response regulator of zinc sigma-54-dependent two-component system [Labilithrix luteola]|uniref:Response regulator of zinc sigma-54-dependent two-component system n=1 Tax=Labilithrix luteola TaxID=1391654 RepID=A0A0K1Q719_9BACT|nr:sigma 54-interacting transcriptional regulator [Labilithrix luteola]AKV01528.1 Response regulator of zinc sigma-54-dependent two-component system [Labilithrix luteola]
MDDRTAPELLDDTNWVGRSRLVLVWESGSATYWLAPGETITVGRGADCTLRIDHPLVSRVHARIYGGDPVAIEDANSSNGVRVRGARIQAGAKVSISPGDLVEVGPALVAVQQPPGPSTEPSTPGQEARERAQALLTLLATVAKSELTVLLLGETGSGKNRAAESIHAQSPRAHRPLVHLNCAAFPESMLEAELFGYERGAFTGAVGAKPGLIEGADGGTLFLDEVGEMPLSTQAKLLGVIEGRNVLRLGSVRPKAIDVRFLAATNRELGAQIADGAFRKDLYFRLNGISITIPPLRERRSEIMELAERFLAEACARAGRAPLAFSADARNLLLSYAWPGNVRELRSAVERAAVLASADRVAASDLGLTFGSSGDVVRPLSNALDALEKERIVEALEQLSGNQTHAARALGISRRALISRLEQYGIPRPRKK